jgi:hypothetical protein
MSTKFEKLLDYLVNEEIDKANDLFHEIVVEKSRTIYENLIDEEESEEFDESNQELEDSYMMDAEDDSESDDTEDKTDDLEADIETGDEDGDEDGDIGGLDDEESSEEQAMFDIKNAIEELEAAFAELEAAQDGEMGGDEFGGDEFGGDEGDGEFGDDDFGGRDEEDLQMGMLEGRRLREYTEKLNHDWDKNAMKGPKGEPAGAGTGEFNRDGETNTKSPVSSGKGKPTSNANGKNLVQGGRGEDQDGTRPHGKAGGFLKTPEDMKTGNGNVPGGKMGVKNLSKVPGGHGAEKKGEAEGKGWGAGTGGPQGQVGNINTKSPLNGAPQRAK